MKFVNSASFLALAALIAATSSSFAADSCPERYRTISMGWINMPREHGTVGTVGILTFHDAASTTEIDGEYMLLDAHGCPAACRFMEVPFSYGGMEGMSWRCVFLSRDETAALLAESSSHRETYERVLTRNEASPEIIASLESPLPVIGSNLRRLPFDGNGPRHEAAPSSHRRIATTNGRQGHLEGSILYLDNGEQCRMISDGLATDCR